MLLHVHLGKTPLESTWGWADYVIHIETLFYCFMIFWLVLSFSFLKPGSKAVTNLLQEKALSSDVAFPQLAVTVPRKSERTSESWSFICFCKNIKYSPRFPILLLFTIAVLCHTCLLLKKLGIVLRTLEMGHTNGCGDSVEWDEKTCCINWDGTFFFPYCFSEFT